MLPRVQSDVSHLYWSLLPFTSNVLEKELNFCHAVNYVLIILCYQNILFCFLGLHCAIFLHMSISYQAERWHTICEQSFVDLFWLLRECEMRSWVSAHKVINTLNTKAAKAAHDLFTLTACHSFNHFDILLLFGGHNSNFLFLLVLQVIVLFILQAVLSYVYSGEHYVKNFYCPHLRSIPFKLLNNSMYSHEQKYGDKLCSKKHFFKPTCACLTNALYWNNAMLWSCAQRNFNFLLMVSKLWLAIVHRH